MNKGKSPKLTRSRAPQGSEGTPADKPKGNPGPRNRAEELTAENVERIAEMEKATSKPSSLSGRAADLITRFCGSMPFFWVHVAWFAVWIVGNLSMGAKALDPFPFNFLTLMVSLEAIFLSTFILISENREARVEARRSHLDLQINLLAEQENTKMIQMLVAISKKLGITKADDEEVAAMLERTRPEKVAEQIEEKVTEKERDQ
jgi:uncharacterized membrane protein